MSAPAVAWLPRTPDARVASVRIRCLAPMRALAAGGWRSELHEPGRRYDAAIFVKRVDAEALALARRLRAEGTTVVLDLCDNPFDNPNGLAAIAAHADAVRAMAAASDVLVASTPRLAEVLAAELRGITPVVVDDALDELVGTVPGSWADRVAGPLALAAHRRWVAAQRAAGRTPLVWFGIHGGPQASHGMADLARIRAALERAHAATPVALTVLSNSASKYRDLVAPWPLPTRYLAWRPGTFEAALALHDVAVLPVTPNPFTLCKSSNRLVSALWAGLAVVADAIPSYEPYRDCVALDDWAGGLARYLGDAERRRADVAAGRRRIAATGRIDTIAARWREVLAGALAAGAAR